MWGETFLRLIKFNYSEEYVNVHLTELEFIYLNYFSISHVLYSATIIFLEAAKKIHLVCNIAFSRVLNMQRRMSFRKITTPSVYIE